MSTKGVIGQGVSVGIVLGLASQPMQHSTALLATLLLTSSLACGDFAASGSFGSGPGQFGATQGGVQDIGLARALIAQGEIPPPEAFVVEGMFSEHDLPLAGDDCPQLLCVRGALGAAPDLEGKGSGWLQVGLSSNLNADSYELPRTTIIATVDVSGSMGWKYDQDDEYASPARLSVALLRKIAAELRPTDRLAIVTYGSRVKEVLKPTDGSEQEKIGEAIGKLSSNGSTNMEEGLQKAYEIAAGEDADEVRVMLFTDVRPNVGATESSEFSRMVAAAADENISTTVFGMGLGLGQEVFEAMSTLRGGNAYSLFQHEDVPNLMEESWPWMVAPVAYNFELEILALSGPMGATYGFPGDGKLSAASIFLSRKRGAMLVQFERPESDAVFASAELSYTTRDGQHVQDNLRSDFIPESDAEFEQRSVQKTLALALIVTGMKNAVTAYSGDPESASVILSKAIDRAHLEQSTLEDDDFATEIDLAESLRKIMFP